jgi:hypothetical protein
MQRSGAASSKLYPARISQPATPQKSALPLRSDKKRVAPGVKAWLDNVLVPALVKQSGWSQGRKITASILRTTQKPKRRSCGEP